ncbi:PH domain-containing protein [Halopiger goleimassiliensis]|uniref:PH domain-containing protein n=1 Tax=Halopiger goleimassiliensis TaxID=1293048 RepID=UPI0006781A3C|nr:PH domain-containing protein [Halopiger goleimassiliensis]
MSDARDGVETRYDEREPTDEDPHRTASVADGLPLLPDETVLVDAKPTWWVWAAHLTIAGLVGVGGLLSAFVDAIVAIPALVFASLVGGYVWYRRNRVRYLVTDRRIVVITGYFGKTTTETWMEDVRGMQTSASRFERRQGYGTITISHGVIPTGFVRTRGLQLAGIPDYENVAAAIRQRQSERKSGTR